MKTNEIKVDINKYDLSNMNSKGFSAIDEWTTSKDFDAYKRYSMNSYFEKINGSLRTGTTNDFFVLEDIKKLDNLFKTIPEEIKPDNEMIVYRGAYLSPELKNILDGKSSSDIYVDKGFVSTSKNKSIAKQFASTDEKVFMQIKIPKGASVIDDTQLPSSACSKMRNEEEVLLPRNSQFKILSYNPLTKIVEAEFIGQQYPAIMPTYDDYTGSDNLAELNKIFMSKEFNSKF